MNKASESREEKQKQHIQEMAEHLNRHFGTSMNLYMKEDLDPSLKEKILESIISMEEAEEQPLFDYLVKEGLSLPPSETLDDAQLHEKLWEVIHAMAGVGQFLSSTDHLSDRCLYETLWNDILREPACISPDASGPISFIDILGGCSQEDLQIRLKYYADEYEREAWEPDDPEDILPEHEDLPYDRDRHLPKPDNGCFFDR